MLKFSLTQPIYAFKSYAYKKECIGYFVSFATKWEIAIKIRDSSVIHFIMILLPQVYVLEQKKEKNHIHFIYLWFR